MQGEGLALGQRHIFLRFPACNLNCAYCDTPRDPCPTFCCWERTPGKRDFAFLPNPLTPEQIVAAVNKWDLTLHHAFSLTGGEPLLYADFLTRLIPLLTGTRKGIYLETNGTLPEQLKQIISMVNIIAMDFKLPSSSRLPPLWEKHRQFLRVARQKDVFVKIVVTENTTDAEIKQALKVIKAVKEVAVIIQPVTLPVNRPGVSPARLLAIQELALRELSEVRIIPQVHKWLQQL